MSRSRPSSPPARPRSAGAAGAAGPLDDRPAPATPGVEALHLVLAGEPTWSVEGSPPQPLSRKDAALLALLVLDGPQPRDRLAALLWPEAAGPSAGASLRQRLHRLRRASGHPVAELSAVVRLASGVQADVAAPRDGEPAALAPGRTPSGELLGACRYDDAEELAEWVAGARARWRQRQAEAWSAEAARLESQGALQEAIAAAERALERAPHQELAWRRLMHLHYLRGDRAAAIEAFARCERHLLDELGTRPSLQTLDLLSSIERIQAPAAPGTPTLPPALLRPPRLVGRAQAWQALHAAWAEGHSVVVLGAAGVGKTRLCRDFVAGQGGDAAAVWSLQARAGDAASPYALLRNLLLAVDLPSRAAQLPPLLRRELARLMPELGPAPEAAGQQPVLWRAVSAALTDGAGPPVRKLLVDDAHQADAASMDLLRWLAGAGVLQLLLSARPDEGLTAAGGDLSRWLAASDRPLPVHLAPWSLPEVQELVASLGLPPWPGLAQALHRHAGGHPYFTLETLKHLALSGAQPGTDQILPVPATVQAVLGHRLSRLSPLARQVVQLGALAGPELDITLLARLLGGAPLDLAPACAELEAADLLRGDRIAHDLLRDVILRELTEPVARALHRQIAQALAQDAGTPPARLALHWRAAGAWPEAAACWMRAGLAARRAGRLAEQQTLLQEAAEDHHRAGDAEGRFDALLATLDSVLVREGPQAKLEALQRLRPLASGPLRQLQCHNAEADALMNLGRYADSLAVTRPLLEAAPPGTADLVDTLCLHGQALAQAGDSAAAVAVLERAAALADERRDAVRALHARSALMFALAAANRPGDARRAQLDALDRALAAGDAVEAALAQGNLATLHLLLGEPQQAWMHASQALRSHADMGSEGGVHARVAQVTLGAAAAWKGHFDEALQALQAARQHLGTQAGPGAHAKVRTVLAKIWQTLGQTAAARDTLEPCLPGVAPVLQALWLLRAAELAQLQPDGLHAGADAPAHRAGVQALLEQHPALREHPALLNEGLPDLLGEQALPVLQAALQRARQQGALGVARSLALRLQGLLPAPDPTELLALAEGLGQSCAPTDFLPLAWGRLARLLQQTGQMQALQQVQAESAAWCQRVRTGLSPSLRPGFDAAVSAAAGG